MRHIIEPSINYAYIPNPNIYGTNLVPQFDYQLPSLRLLPTTMPDYNSIDSIQGENVFRFGLHKKLQTKREGKVVDFVDWNIYTDYYIHPNTNQTTFSDFYSDLVIRPRSWLTIESLIRYEIMNDNLRMSLTTVSIRPNKTWSWTVGQLYLQSDLSGSPIALGAGTTRLPAALCCGLTRTGVSRQPKYMMRSMAPFRTNSIPFSGICGAGPQR